MDQHLADDVVWHVGGNSKWAGAYQGKAQVLDFFARQAQAMGGMPSVEVHDVLGNDDHVVTLGTAKATAPDGSSAEWKYTQIFHIRDGKTTEVWGMAENDAAVDPFLDSLPGGTPVTGHWADDRIALATGAGAPSPGGAAARRAERRSCR